MPIHGLVDSAIRIPLALLTAKERAALDTSLSYANPAYAAVSKRFARRMEIPERLGAAREEGDHLVVPRGAIGIVRALGAVLNERYLSRPPAGLAFRGELRDYQAAAVDSAFAAGHGVIVAPCGSGKTTIALALLARCDQPALVLVSSLDLVEQWATRIREHLGVEAGRCASGRMELADVTVATVQSARDPARLAVLRERFGLILLDECHHAPAQTFADVVGAFPARFRFGVTATPSRADGLEALTAHHLGPIAHTVETRALVDAGHLVRPAYVRVETAFEFAYGGPSDWAPLLDALVACPTRNRLIEDTIVAECTPGVVGLALTGRVAHAEHLRHRLAARGLRAAALTGSASKGDRNDALSRARDGALDVIVATQLADEGLDVPRLARMFLCFPGRSEMRLLQRIGRIMRPHEGKGAPEVKDFVDVRVGVLANQASKRAQAFEALWGAPSAA